MDLYISLGSRRTSHPFMITVPFVEAVGPVIMDMVVDLPARYFPETQSMCCAEGGNSRLGLPQMQVDKISAGCIQSQE